MKKIIFLFAIVIITIIACNPLKPDPSKAISSTFTVADSIPGSLAESMIIHYLDTVLVDHSLEAINKQTSLYNSDLYKIFKIKNVTRIKLLVAAYLDTDPNVARRNKLTVLIQVKKGYSSNYYYYDIQTLGASRICPPPPGCSTLILN